MFNVFIRTLRMKIIPRQDLGKTTGLIVMLNNLSQPLAGLLVVTILRRTPRTTPGDGLEFLRDFALFYALLLPFMSSFVTAEIPFDRRNLAPIYLTFSLWAIVKIWTMVKNNLRLAWSAAAVLIIALNSWTSIEWLNLLFTRGIGFSSAAWRSSPTIAYVTAHRMTHVLTNAPDPIFLLSATPAAMLPRHTDPGTGKKNAGYAEQIAEIKRNSAVVVYFRTVKWRWYLPDEQRLKAELALHPVADLGDGAVYFVGDAQSAALRAR